MTGSTINYGFPFPEGTNSVLTHEDIEKLAVAVDAKLLALLLGVIRFNLPSLSPTSDLDTLENNFYSVWNGDTAQALGLPNATLGVLGSFQFGTGAGTQLWIPRVSGDAQLWIRNELSTAWTNWTRIGGGAGQTERMLRTASGGGFKSAPLALTLGYGGAQTTGSGTTVVVQHMPATAERVQLHLRNWNPRYAMADSPAVQITATAIGLHNGAGGSAAWTPLPAEGPTEYASGWVAVPEAWRGQDVAVRYSWSSTGTIQRCIGTGWTNGAKDNTPPMFGWLEVEVPASTPVVAAFGDSLSSGVSSSRPVVDSWIDQWARENGAVPAHWSHSGDKAVNWPASAQQKWGLYGWDIAAPDALVYCMGSNDLSEAGITFADMQTRIADTVSQIKRQITSSVFAATILPRTNQPAGSTFETVRRQVNTWLPESGLVRDVFAFAAAVSSDDENLDPAIDADGVHLTSAGYKRLADAIARPIVTPAVTYLGDGVYEVA
ncbi:GDSL-type esterase/lipase family protein [Brachybacterium phenoliresistens]|uniref:GDSL-type esterase/lipase family protein n=1 Tax=Brachybacterium phenoliresistens TaxID=396014 RepID=UPI0031E482D0